MDAEHLIREIEQINLIQQKLIKGLEAGNQKPDSILETMSDLDVLHSMIANVAKNLESNKNLSKEKFEKVHHDLRTPLTPILAYVEMLLLGQYGPLNERQREKTTIIKSNLKKLIDAVNSFDYDSATQEIRDQKQQNEFLDNLDHEIHNEGKSHEDLSRQKRELEQEKMILDKTIRAEEEKNARLGKKHVVSLAAMMVVTAGIVAGYTVYMDSQEQYQVSNMNANTGYLIQNLRGDTIDTWLSWRLVDGAILHINVPNAAKYPGKLALVKEVVQSQDAIQLDDSLLHKGPSGSSKYYKGWAGALKAASQKQTEFYIPQSFDVLESSTGEGEITITLTDARSGDGLSGYTKSIADDSQNQILKSEITIYETDKLTDEQFKAILRHEFGHALGLAHSTAPEDLMHATIVTLYPYISDCDIDAIVKLYDGGKSSQVECEK